MRIFVRALGSFFLLLAAVIAASSATARMVVDSSGRHVEVPDTIQRVFAAGPPAEIFLYVVAPEKMISWGPQSSKAGNSLLLPLVRDLPDLGRLTGRGGTISLERLMASRPDIIVDFGSVNETYRSLADRVQSQTGIPYLLIDGSFDNSPAVLRLLADILGVPQRGEQLARAAEEIFARVDRIVASVPQADRPRVYLARGTDGFETGASGSIHTEIIEQAGGVNVVDSMGGGGLVHVSPEQVINWAPDTILAIGSQLRSSILERPEWQAVPAVRQGRVLLPPDNPFNTIDFPPSVSRLIGLPILVHAFYPGQTTFDLREEVRSFYKLFYQVDVTDTDMDLLLEGMGE